MNIETLLTLIPGDKVRLIGTNYTATVERKRSGIGWQSHNGVWTNRRNHDMKKWEKVK